MKDRFTHVPKKVMINGKEKIVYARTEETDKYLDNYRMGFYANYEPLNIDLFQGKIKENHLIIQTSYETAHRVIRTRLGLDKRPHKVFTGTTFLQHYFANENYRDGFPVFKQFYLIFSYTDSKNKIMHENIVDTLFTRYHSGNHFWLLIPKSLEVLAAQWGPALLSLKKFPFLKIESQGYEEVSPVSVASSLESPEDGSPAAGDIGQDAGYPKTIDGIDDPPPLSDDPEEDRKRKRERGKWRRKSYE